MDDDQDTNKAKNKRLRSKRKRSGAYRRNKKKIICEVCGDIAISFDSLMQHLRTTHAREIDNQTLEDLSAKAFKSK